jgi:hypothetical protein
MGKRSVKAIRTTLKELATGSGAYDSAYASAMERIESQVPDQTDLAKQVLGWIVHAKRQFSAVELQEALGVEAGDAELDRDNCPDVDDMVSACAGLVTIDGSSGVIRLVHYTTQEYFDRTRHAWFPNADAMITTVCLTYLSFRVFDQDCRLRHDEPSSEHYPGFYFHLYAARYWPRHAPFLPSVDEQVLNFLKQPKNSLDEDVCRVGRHSWAHIDCRFRLALIIATLRGHESLAKLILEHADGGALSSRHVRKELCLLTYNEYEVKISLLRGNEPLRTWQPDYSKYDDNSPPRPHSSHVEILIRGRSHGREHVDAVPAYQVLECTPANESAEVGGSLGRRLMYEVVSMGYVPLVRELLNYHIDVNPHVDVNSPVDINFRNLRDGNTPLQCAIQNRHALVVLMLLEHGADTTIRNNRYETALWMAISNGEWETSATLIAFGADVNCRAWRCNEALRARWDRLLLLRNAATNTQVQCGDCLLHIACKRGSVALTRLLLGAGADANCVNDLGRSPIYYARALGHAHVVKELLVHGAGDSLGRPLPSSCTTGPSSKH